MLFQTLRKKTRAYWLLLISYLSYGIYTFWFHINNGVDVIRTIQPLWAGTISGKLYPYILYHLGLVNEYDEPTWVFLEEQKSEDSVAEESAAENSVDV